MTTPDNSLREPCPDRILDDIGGAFSMGAIGGSAFYFLRGIHNSPKGTRFIGGREAVMMNVPRMGGSFAVWGGMFSALDCTMVYARQKEDPWNTIISAAATGGFLQMRQGLRPAMRSAAGAGLLLALVGGLSITSDKLASAQEPMPVMTSQVDPETSSSSSGWFGGLFGGKQAEVKTKVETKVLESFDSPVPPSFEFT